MSRHIRGLLTCLLALGLAAPAAAGTIKMAASANAKFDNGHLTVNLTLVNQGDEAAQNLSLKLISGDQQVEAAGPAMLPPNQPSQAKLELDVAPQTPGTYPSVIEVRFHDLNGYPFTSLASALYFKDRPTFPQVLGKGLPSVVAGEGEMSFELASLDQAPLKVGVRFFPPRELTLGRDQVELNIAGRTKETVSVPVKNFTALAGATYPVLAVLEYEKEGLHYTAVSVAMASVAQPPSPIARMSTYLYIAAGLLVLLVAWLQWRRRKA